ncbi:thiopeptide-type bacteriocin biosynthesis protein [Chryseobacterium sp. L7]|uniref:Thiopeptide-type bacteriocin biosynthesis protein n=1 Tax=Chryseobacterium endalhagicum TaxID=2797638 RepID=A0ABS1QDC7_9FLAO|nr:thiopeptide-type bacteriocin biosynthesis protein [Chryseobacterium endalhagicum]MBL1220576.1 thiopeptide-type bacteriocin biosynthesis protein [Chryseobacterium endalhagicum]
METNWKTYYLYHKDHADTVLKGVVHPCIENIETALKREVQFFFIRYFENGYHIRLRLLLTDEESDDVLSLLKDHITAYENLSGDSITLKEAEYIPETERYGNTKTMIYAEEQFCASSRFILHNLVQNNPLTASERYLLALKTHLVFFKGSEFPQSSIQQLCDKFIQSWLPVPFSENADEQEQDRKNVLNAFQNQFDLYRNVLTENLTEFWNSLDQPTDSLFQEFLKTNKKVFKGYSQSRLSADAVDEALLSFIHMANNRLGIVNAEESYILFLIMQMIPLIHNYDSKPEI